MSHRRIVTRSQPVSPPCTEPRWYQRTKYAWPWTERDGLPAPEQFSEDAIGFDEAYMLQFQVKAHLKAMEQTEDKSVVVEEEGEEGEERPRVKRQRSSTIRVFAVVVLEGELCVSASTHCLAVVCMRSGQTVATTSFGREEQVTALAAKGGACAAGFSSGRLLFYSDASSLKDPLEIGRTQGAVGALACHSQRPLLFAACGDGLSCYSLDTRTQLWALPALLAGPIDQLCLSSSGEHLLAASSQTPRFRLLQLVGDCSGPPLQGASGDPAKDSDGVAGVACAPPNRFLVCYRGVIAEQCWVQVYCAVQLEARLMGRRVPQLPPLPAPAGCSTAPLALLPPCGLLGLSGHCLLCIHVPLTAAGKLGCPGSSDRISLSQLPTPASLCGPAFRSDFYSAAHSADGRFVVAVGDHNSIWIWHHGPAARPSSQALSHSPPSTPSSSSATPNPSPSSSATSTPTKAPT
ncbi:MAG: hypothetical protein Q8P67_13210 [archaeon]|nr:hypothetical protein [archaeon]